MDMDQHPQWAHLASITLNDLMERCEMSMDDPEVPPCHVHGLRTIALDMNTGDLWGVCVRYVVGARLKADIICEQVNSASLIEINKKENKNLAHWQIVLGAYCIRLRVHRAAPWLEPCPPILIRRGNVHVIQ